MSNFCPGSAGFKGTPTLKIKSCPECGADVELFSNSMQTNCPKCGFCIYNDTISCILWCKYARDCVGDEMYENFHAARAEAAASAEAVE